MCEAIDQRSRRGHREIPQVLLNPGLDVLRYRNQAATEYQLVGIETLCEKVSVSHEEQVSSRVAWIGGTVDHETLLPAVQGIHKEMASIRDVDIFVIDEQKVFAIR